MTDRMTLPQGDVGLLDTDLALTLLTSTIPARVALFASARPATTPPRSPCVVSTLAPTRWPCPPSRSQSTSMMC